MTAPDTTGGGKLMRGGQLDNYCIHKSSCSAAHLPFLSVWEQTETKIHTFVIRSLCAERLQTNEKLRLGRKIHPCVIYPSASGVSLAAGRRREGVRDVAQQGRKNHFVFDGSRSLQDSITVCLPLKPKGSTRTTSWIKRTVTYICLNTKEEEERSRLLFTTQRARIFF